MARRPFMSNISHRRTSLVALSAALLLGAGSQAMAVNPRSSEVRELIKKAFDFLDKNTHDSLGGKALVGLAYLKDDNPQPDHPRVKEALEACRAAARMPIPQDHRGPFPQDMYSNGLAIIFLCEEGGRKNADLVKYYLNMLKRRQKPHGGWGYDHKPTGDTSQTQYAALSFWEAHHNGFAVEADMVQGLSEWLMRTQDPSGAWGYQGVDSESVGKRVEQNEEEITCSMAAAAMGSTLIAADLFGLLQPGAADEAAKPGGGLPPALRVAGEEEVKRAPNLRSSTFKRKEVFDTLRLGNQWMDKNYKPQLREYTVYYLYALERYKSFQENLDGSAVREPVWYQNGYEYLKNTQAGDGSWSAGCGSAPDTAFGILFLVRSTRKMLDRSIGDIAIGRRGLPTYSPGMKFVEGQFVIEQTNAAVGDLMNMLSDEASAKIDQLAANPTALMVTGELDEAAEQRLRQVVRSGSPAARVLAVRALSRTGKLDQVPTLIFALTDPDRQVTLQARDGLRFISRRFEGFGLPDNYDDKQRFTAIDKWKQWYESIRPGATVTLQ